jgi:hypothetical protein
MLLSVQLKLEKMTRRLLAYMGIFMSESAGTSKPIHVIAILYRRGSVCAGSLLLCASLSRTMSRAFVQRFSGRLDYVGTHCLRAHRHITR